MVRESVESVLIGKEKIYEGKDLAKRKVWTSNRRWKWWQWRCHSACWPDGL